MYLFWKTKAKKERRTKGASATIGRGRYRIMLSPIGLSGIFNRPRKGEGRCIHTSISKWLGRFFIPFLPLFTLARNVLPPKPVCSHSNRARVTFSYMRLMRRNVCTIVLCTGGVPFPTTKGRRLLLSRFRLSIIYCYADKRREARNTQNDLCISYSDWTFSFIMTVKGWNKWIKNTNLSVITRRTRASEWWMVSYVCWALYSYYFLDESKPFRCLLAPSCADRAEWVILPFFYAAGAAFTSPEMKMMFAGLGRQVKRWEGDRQVHFDLAL